MEAILDKSSTRKHAFIIILALFSLAFGGCSQKASSAETGAKAKAAASKSAAKPASKATHLAQASPSYQAAPPAQAARANCANCGVVVSVKEIDQEGKGSGLGVVAGGLAGGVIGNQVGNGTGRDLATIAGAVGGAIFGNKVEEKIKKTRVYDVTVKLEDGEERIVRSRTVPGVMAGDKVRIEGERVIRQ